jgi:site-specific DNA recombinase
MRAALYARVSSEEQVEGYSIDAQRRAFQALVDGRGWTMYREYVDEGKSARIDNINKRPAFKEMMSDAVGAKFDVLVVHKLDRFSRNLRITLEYFDKLLNAGVTFISINEQMDFTTPSGKVHLALLGAFAQYYSDNLSQETKKGWHERRAQGLYCGLLPFGVMKGQDGVPVPDTKEIHLSGRSTCNYEGLQLAFQAAANGRSDREVAQVINAAGYRTAGNQGNRPFSKDTIRGMLTNRFYLGYLPNGNGGWIKGKHEALVNEELWNQVQEMRRRNATSTHTRCRSGRRVCSLTGITYCWYCKGRIHVRFTKKGKARLGCYNRAKGWECPQKSTLLEVYEEQIGGYLSTFHIPPDYQNRILDSHRRLQSAYDNVDSERAKWEAQLQRIKNLYKWGDLGREEYLKEKDGIQKELKALAPAESQAQNLDKLAEFLANIAQAWEEATGELRNKLARSLFQEIWIKDKQVVAVKPQPELTPFFQFNYEEYVNKVLKKRPRGDSNP